MRDIPISEILKWPAPNYSDPETRGNSLLVVNTVLLVLASLIVVLRIYTRVVIKRWFGLDDTFILLALLITIGLNVAVGLGTSQYGWNRHIWDIPLPTLTYSLKVAFTAKILFLLSSTFTRCSLLCFYYRLVSDTEIKWFRNIIHAALAFVVIVNTIFLGIAIWACSPIRAYWIWPQLPGSKCLNEAPLMLSASVASSLCDIIVAVIPIPLVMKLMMPLRKRLAVLGLFSLGFIATTAGFVKIYYIWWMYIASYDQSWGVYPVYIATSLEVHLGIICASIPSARPLLGLWLSRSFSFISRTARSFSGASASTDNSTSPMHPTTDTSQQNTVGESVPHSESWHTNQDMAAKDAVGEKPTDIDVEANECMYLEDSSDAEPNLEQDLIMTEKYGARTFYFQ